MQDRLDGFLARPHRAVWVVSAPIMAGMLLMVASTAVETAFIGRLGRPALAALTIVFPLLFTMIALVNGVGTGITALVAQAIGRRDVAEAQRIGGTAIAFGLILGGLFALAGVLAGRPLLHQLGATDEVAELASGYFLVLALSAPLLFVGAFLRFVLNGEGDARTPAVVMLFVTVGNAGLDYLCIFTLQLGMRGAAVAGAIAQFAATLVMLYLMLFRRGNLVKLHWRHLVPSWPAVKAVLEVGIPNSLTQLVLAFGAMALNRVVASFGEGALAAFGVGARVDQAAVMPVVGLASGSVAVIGMFAGAGRIELVRDVAAYALKWAFAISAVLGTVAYLASVPLMGLFTDSPETIATGRHYLKYMVFAYPMVAVVMMSARILLGLNYPRLSLLIVSVRLFLLAVPIAYLSVFVFHAPIDGIWWGLVIGSAGSVVASAALLRWIVWVKDPTERAAKRVVVALG